MRLLIDTHVLLWWLFQPSEVGPRTREALEGADDAAVSLASLWELAIKFAKGRFEYSPARLMLGVGSAGFAELDIAHRHIVKFPSIQLPHGDPFDRMLVAQAESDGLTLVTADRTLLASPYATLDARA